MGKPFPPDESSQVTSHRVTSNHRWGWAHFLHQSRRVRSGVYIMQVDVLINLFRERPAIYDPTDRSHRDRDVIAALWKEVAAALK
ncbi:putative Alcohol dehydrogenase transcription factor Myb/SANT-like-containing protein 11 [Homarus americanus]|uniref:Putative Alcohol dehydrogenase transcription factor Myb/SANT-like-containing protein 11 n=1 Tax=Homarus americanus TaxID=6706 RepID=A0A8J5K6M2_HOMAM|nr:putative Alcohol dehydrogenase transcription factor Myb/SANT-like-containing protein 11 [Homarus americanus]